MTAKHCLSESAKRRQSLAGKSAQGGRGLMAGIVVAACTIVFGSMIVAAGIAALAVNAAGSGHQPPAAEQAVSQEGTLIAVSADSITARSRDGITRTYLVTPETAVITRAGSPFTVNDEVDILATIRNGTALATAVAHRDMGHGAAPPMDHVTAQPVSGTLDSD